MRKGGVAVVSYVLRAPSSPTASGQMRSTWAPSGAEGGCGHRRDYLNVSCQDLCDSSQLTMLVTVDRK